MKVPTRLVTMRALLMRLLVVGLPMVCVIEGLVKQRRVRVRLLSVFVVARARTRKMWLLVLMLVSRWMWMWMWMWNGKNWKDVKPRWMRKTRLEHTHTKEGGLSS